MTACAPDRAIGYSFEACKSAAALSVRLDNFAIELQNDPTATAYVIVYPGRNSRRGDVQHHSSRVIEYLVHSRGLDERRIVTLVGAPREQLFVELWITPQGATPPTP